MLTDDKASSTGLQAMLKRGELITAALPTAIDAEHFTPRLLALLSNALIWTQSQAFHRDFGLATNDWRVLSALASWPGYSASEIANSLSINKAVVGTSVRRLAARKLLVLIDGPRGTRPMYLTPEGARMHDGLAVIAVRGQTMIEDELGAEGTDALNTLLRRLTARTLAMKENDGKTEPAPPPSSPGAEA